MTDSVAVVPKPRELTADQRAALNAARKAQRQFERAQVGYERASDERAAAFRAALEAGMTYGELASEFGVPRGSIQAAAAGRERKR